LISRRQLFKTSVAIAGAIGLRPAQQLVAATPSCATHNFPSGFLWGSATASYQVEGAVNEDGRGQSIWDTFSHARGHTFQENTGDTADDFYHRYKEDVALMKSLGLRAFRFSIAWPRIFPNGTGAPNPKGLEFYDRLVDELLASGIQPFCTLFHWDLPQTLEDKGGWASRETAYAFAEYAGYVASRLSDRIQHWMTINEFASFIDNSYGATSTMAPGRHLSRAELMQTRHYAVLAHGLAVQAVRGSAKRPVQIGIAESISGAAPAIETPEHIAAAERAMRLLNAPYTTVILEGKYPQEYLDSLGSDAPRFTAEELKIISSPLDFYGANIYSTSQVLAADNAQGYVKVPHSSSYPHMLSNWLYIAPEALYWTPKLMAKIWGIKNIYITENGCSAADALTPGGKVLDTERVFYLRAYLSQLQRAVADGVPVKGYFLWSLLDNFEWARGYSERFGIVYVDYRTLKRTPKLSAEFYRQTILKNALV